MKELKMVKGNGYCDGCVFFDKENIDCCDLPIECYDKKGNDWTTFPKLEKELEALKAKLAFASCDELLSQAQQLNGLKLLAARLEGADVNTLREAVDRLKHKLGSAAVVLASVEEDKVRLVAGVSADQTKRLKAGELVNAVAQKVGGKGGGRPDMATAGGNDPSQLDAALAAAAEWVRGRLG